MDMLKGASGQASGVVSSMAGKYMSTKGNNVRLRDEPNTSSKIIATIPVSGTPIGQSSGIVSNDVFDAKDEWWL